MGDESKDNPETAKTAVISLHSHNQKHALERINRMTGLDFDVVPTSIISQPGGLQLTEDDGEELIYRALYLWGDKPPSGR